MARGWESKSVEQQQDEARDQKNASRSRLSPAQQKHNRQREGLLLARKRISDQLAAAEHPTRREMLIQSLAELDRQISCFDSITDSSTRK